MKFKYTAINQKNQKKSDIIEAATENEAINILRNKGLVVQDIAEAPANAESNNIFQKDIGGDYHKQKIKPKKLLMFLNQMALMMKAGINLSLAMEIMITTEKDKTVKKIMTEMNQDLYNGITLSQSMRKFKAFPSIIVSIVEAGEANGRLDTAFDQCALITKKDIALKGKLKSAFMYPIFLIVLIIVVIIVLCCFVLPTFTGVYDSFGAELPGLTKVVMGFSDFLIGYWWLLLLIVGAVTVSFILLKKNSAEFAMKFAQFQMKIPLVGPIIRQSSLARFCRLMSTLTDAGIPIHRAMALSRDTVSNLFVRARITDVINDVQIGVPINEAMRKHPVFDPILVSMIRVGEESGMLGDSLFKMADLFESQTEESTQRLTDMMTPIMTVVIGVVVGFLVISIILPMFGMYSIIGASES